MLAGIELGIEPIDAGVDMVRPRAIYHQRGVWP
jgi:hypothetical protein